jgi:hypothetical protein
MVTTAHTETSAKSVLLICPPITKAERYSSSIGEGGYNEPIPDYELQAWDEGLQTWTTILSRTGNTSSAVVETFQAVATSKIRLLNDPGVQVKLFELEIYTGGV